MVAAKRHMSVRAETPIKPLKGKYDGRVANNKRMAKERKRAKPWAERHLGRNTAAKLFRKIDIYQRFIDLLATDDNRLKFEVMRYLWDRLEGKPYVATNPNEVKQPNVMIDARVQTALQQYVVDPKAVSTPLLEAVTVTQAAEKRGEGEEN